MIMSDIVAYRHRREYLVYSFNLRSAFVALKILYSLQSKPAASMFQYCDLDHKRNNYIDRDTDWSIDWEWFNVCTNTI